MMIELKTVNLNDNIMRSFPRLFNPSFKGIETPVIQINIHAEYGL